MVYAGIPVYCRAGEFDDLNIELKKGYLIITPKK